MTTLPPWPEGPADAMERALLETWRAEDLFRQVQAATADGAPFVFYEGPPTANGRPGIHHVFARSIKDLVCRFRAMQGRQVTRIAGWDTHGLPVEIEVEKALGLKGKKQIEAYGIAEFNRKARESVWTYKAEWEQLSERIAFWLDYDRPYVTYTNEYVETVWWLLRRLHDRQLLVRGHRVLPYCPRCGTVLSSHELALGYDEISTNSVHVTFPLRDGTDRSLVVWTTTPWTLPSNVAVAVHPELEYGEYEHPRHPGRLLVVGTKLADRVLGDQAVLRRTFAGRELVGRPYARPLDVVPLPPEGAREVVVPGPFVTDEDGSGLVHLAPAFGADDFQAGKDHGLAFVRPVAADGTFTGTTWPELEGQLVTAKETNDLIIRRLKETGHWLATREYRHSYPHCWRCKSKLVYYARDSWFVRTSAVKQRMLEINAGVRWHPPEVGSGRFGEWLENNVDWALSRDRYWGTPLPVWVSDRDPEVVEVIGSYAELEAKLGRPLPEGFDPHKPTLDDLTWPAPGGGTMRRVPEVIDTWFDSGAMPYAQWHYPFAHEAEFARHFPADFICEGLDQTRGWFYSLLAIAATAFDAPAYRNVIVNGLVLDADGQKMSKSRGNTVDPHEMVRLHGADAVRLYLLASGQVWLPKRFDARQIPEVAGGFLNTLRNSYTFLALYATGASVPDAPPPPDRPLADRWLLSRLAATVDAVTAAWEGYDVTTGIRALMEFVVDDLSNWYVRLNRARFWAPGHDADAAAVATLREALVGAARLLAPAAPFAADWLHRALGEGSVHLARFPAAGGARDVPLERAMDAVRRLASLARAAREERGLRVRQPVARLRVAVPADVRGPAFDALLDLLATEVNAKRIEPVTSDADLVRLRGKANFRALGKRFGKATPAVAAAVEGLAPAQLRALEAGEGAALDAAQRAALPAGDLPDVVTLLPDEVTVVREVLVDWPVASDGPFVAALDPDLTDALRQEGLAREVVSRIQRLRKEAGFDYTARIHLWVDGAEALRAAVGAHAAFIAEETLARSLELGRAPASDVEQQLEVDGLPLVLAVRKVQDGLAA
ncbi:MAG: isoleucine--tRNA ligase [Gemmatimonadales bacterium]|nr:isoleucine--tRNA ligase [Gemmatimonadales bacterium]